MRRNIHVNEIVDSEVGDVAVMQAYHGCGGSLGYCEEASFATNASVRAWGSTFW